MTTANYITAVQNHPFAKPLCIVSEEMIFFVRNDKPYQPDVVVSQIEEKNNV